MRWALPIIAAAAMFGLSLLGGPGMRASQPLRGGDPMLSLALPRLPQLTNAVAAVTAPGCAMPASAQQQAWNATRLWLGSLQGWSDSPAVLAWRDFVHRTKHGTPLPQPAEDACTQAGLPQPAAG